MKKYTDETERTRYMIGVHWMQKETSKYLIINCTGYPNKKCSLAECLKGIIRENKWNMLNDKYDEDAMRVFFLVLSVTMKNLT